LVIFLKLFFDFLIYFSESAPVYSYIPVEPSNFIPTNPLPEFTDSFFSSDDLPRPIPAGYPTHMNDYDSYLPNQIVPNSLTETANSVPSYQLVGHGSWNHHQVDQPVVVDQPAERHMVPGGYPDHMDDYDSYLPNEIVPNSGRARLPAAGPKFQRFGPVAGGPAAPAVARARYGYTHFEDYDMTNDLMPKMDHTYGSDVYNRLLPTHPNDKYLMALARFYSKNNPGRK